MPYVLRAKDVHVRVGCAGAFRIAPLHTGAMSLRTHTRRVGPGAGAAHSDRTWRCSPGPTRRGPTPNGAGCWPPP